MDTTGTATAVRPGSGGRRAIRAGARAGLTARGVIYVLTGILALRIAFGGSSQQADRGGAVAELAAQPLGGFLVWALTVGLAGMTLWRLSEAAFGAAGPDGGKASKRVQSGVRAVFYGFVTYSVATFAVNGGSGGGSGGSSDQASKDVTAEVLGWPMGRWLVGAAGLVLVGAGGWIAVRAIMRRFRKHLRTGAMSARTRKVVETLGVGGGTSRGVVFAAAGCFAVIAAVRFDPGRAKGLDDTLRTFRETPAGPWLLAAVAVGLVLFGLFSGAMARWRDV
ncbi:DUF1206 domain-containing protein [Streptomyces sp. MI02-7b]|uniref:DUF1206 domain-containing protein n=1 Tax=Streptomyces sp. MI02-7b TaxID=462941 RepID=UPI0029B5C447|nr:DUF1206 domain-containing protein [Streptomyces sp. MI02-7b]MDX3078540.1 DUF1206 domain-containing protein [Streptomyces sp. MI02-7b]